MKTDRIRLLGFAGIVIAIAQTMNWRATAASKAADGKAFARLPIKELTVFKDGHACVAQEGEMPTDENGDVLMDYLPTPVMGAFWPYATDLRARLTSVVAGQKRVRVERTALDLRQLLEANIGEEAFITEAGAARYAATIVALPSRSGEELTATSPPNSPERLPEKGNVVLLRTEDGFKVLNLDRLQDVTFKKSPKPAASSEEFRNLLTLKLDWGKAKPARSAKVGLFYVQKGVRWIPAYKLEIDGQGHATVKLHATLINEMADLEDVSVNLVIGVPTFAFKDTVDPMALQQTLAQLSQYFGAAGSYQNSPLASQFSNAIMSQAPRMGDYRGGSEPGPGQALGPEIGGSGQTEDLFMFTVRHVTLKKGERIVLPVAEFTLPYQDVYTLELPYGPPPELRHTMGSEYQRELAKLFNSPKVIHKLRLTNTSSFPLTTAPALIVRDGRVLAQGLMTYTSTGVSVDLPVTTAVQFQVKKTETETKRVPDALHYNGSGFVRVNLTGSIALTSHQATAAELEVTRYVLGGVDSAGHEGKIETLNLLDEDAYSVLGETPYWWGWCNWPSWWNQVNGIGRITWKLRLEPSQSAELGYEWHYFWP